MVVIKVAENDSSKVFGILMRNGRFAGLPDNRYRIEENVDNALKNIKEAGIKLK